MNPSALLTPIRLYRQTGSVASVMQYYRGRFNNRQRAKREQQSRTYFQSLKNKHAGQRGFVIGNGPSLRIEDLDRLQSDICIASNKIYLAFPKTLWRPSYYTVADKLVWEKTAGGLHEHFRIVHIPDYLNPANCRATIYTYPALEIAGTVSPTDFSSDLAFGAYGGHTVTFDNLQFAAHLGLNPIYIIGCDHNYVGEKNVIAAKPVVAGAEQNHFIANYRQPGEVVNPAPIDLMEQAYRCAEQYGKRHGIQILNATRGGHLEIFERANLDDVL